MSVSFRLVCGGGPFGKAVFRLFRLYNGRMYVNISAKRLKRVKTAKAPPGKRERLYNRRNGEGVADVLFGGFTPENGGQGTRREGSGHGLSTIHYSLSTIHRGYMPGLLTKWVSG